MEVEEDPYIKLVLLAEFDNNQGSKISYVVPSVGRLEEFGIQEEGRSLLADLMLPEGAQKRDWDYTAFLLNRPKATKVFIDEVDWEIVNTEANNQIRISQQPKLPQPQQPRQQQQNKQPQPPPSPPQQNKQPQLPPPSPQKQQNKQQQQLPQQQNKQPQQQQQQPQPQLPQQRVNQKPNLSQPQPTLSKSQSSTLSQSQPLSNSQPPSVIVENNFPKLLYCYNLIHTKKDRDVQRGAVIKSLAIVCTHQFFHVYRPFIWQTLNEYFEAPSLKLIENLYRHLNHINLKKVLHIRQKYNRFWNATNHIEKYYSLTSNFNNSVIPIAIPIHFLPDEVAEASLTLLLHTFGEKTSIIYRAILLEKRVVFCGHNLPAWLTCKFVFSACLLGIPMEGILKMRAYPYLNFGSFDFLDTEGYILGVANPFLKDKGPEFWDVFCDIVSNEVITEAPSSSFVTNVIKVFRQEITDTAKQDPILDMVKKAMIGLQKNYGESWLRQQFRRNTIDIISATLMEEMGEHKEVFDKNFIQQFKTKNSYQLWANENMHLLSQAYLPGNAPISRAIWDLTQMVKKLKSKLTRSGNVNTNITQSWMIVVTQKVIEIAVDDDQIMEVFTVLAENKFHLTDKIIRNPDFPEDLKHQWLLLESRHQCILSSLLHHQEVE